MNEKHNPDEILKDLLPELGLQELEDLFQTEAADEGIDSIAADMDDDALINALSAEVTTAGDALDEELEFELNEYLPEEFEETDGTDVDTEELELPIDDMDDGAVIPEAEEASVPESVESPDDESDEFDIQFTKNEDVRKQPPANRERPIRKGRPKRKKGAGLLGIPHMLATVVWLLLILAIGVSMGRFLWVCASDVLAFGREEKIVTVDGKYLEYRNGADPGARGIRGHGCARRDHAFAARGNDCTDPV